MRLFEPYSARQSRTLRRVPGTVAAIRSRHAQSVARTPDEGLENTMVKQIEIYGQRIEVYSPDKGRTWSSSPRAFAAYDRRKKTARLDLKKGFETIDEMQDPDPNSFAELELPESLVGRL